MNKQIVVWSYNGILHNNWAVKTYNVDEFHKYNFGQKAADTRDSIYMKFKNR